MVIRWRPPRLLVEIAVGSGSLQGMNEKDACRVESSTDKIVGRRYRRSRSGPISDRAWITGKPEGIVAANRGATASKPALPKPLQNGTRQCLILQRLLRAFLVFQKDLVLEWEGS